MDEIFKDHLFVAYSLRILVHPKCGYEFFCEVSEQCTVRVLLGVI